MPIFSSGTIVLIPDPTAPVGWTNIASLNGNGIRIVTGAGGVANSSPIYSWASSLSTQPWANSGPSSPGGAIRITVNPGTGSNTLIIDHMAAHRHVGTGLHQTAAGVTVYTGSFNPTPAPPTYSQGCATSSPTALRNSNSAGSDSGHNHLLSTFSSSQGNISFTSGSANLEVSYINALLCQKD